MGGAGMLSTVTRAVYIEGPYERKREREEGSNRVGMQIRGSIILGFIPVLAFQASLYLPLNYFIWP